MYCSPKKRVLQRSGAGVARDPAATSCGNATAAKCGAVGSPVQDNFTHVFGKKACSRIRGDTLETWGVALPAVGPRAQQSLGLWSGSQGPSTLNKNHGATAHTAPSWESSSRTLSHRCAPHTVCHTLVNSTSFPLTAICHMFKSPDNDGRGLSLFV